MLSKQGQSLLQDLSSIFQNTQIKIKEHAEKPLYIYLSQNNDKLKFRIVEYKENKSKIDNYECELVVTGLKSEIGELFGTILYKFIPFKTFRKNREVLSITVSNDFIFLRFYRYAFRNDKNIDFMDIGPKLTLRLLKIWSDGEIHEFKYKKKISEIL
ncbi:Ribosome production factor 1 [Dictyocoela muelleri]|nr:Ribosome production factor 1 [Dictyocoela muelleri]